MNVIMMITNLIAAGIDYLGQTNNAYKITSSNAYLLLLNENVSYYVNCLLVYCVQANGMLEKLIKPF